MIKDYSIKSEKITYFKNDELIKTTSNTEAKIQSKYNIKSKNISFLLNKKELSSKEYSIIKDNKSQVYNLDEFIFLTDKKILKGKNVVTITNYNMPKSDKFYFSEGIFDLDNQNFVGKETKINIHKNIFDEEANDPRLYGVSSKGDGNLTTVNKGIFTSCQITEDCAPWSIKSEKIQHNKEKNK